MRVRWRGSAFGRNVISNITLHPLHNQVLPADSGEPIMVERVHQLPGIVISECAQQMDDFYTVTRSTDGWRSEFPGWATVVVSPDGHHVRALAHPRCSPATLAHLTCDIVLPAAVAATGMTAFHASAVAYPDGAVMFLGPSGRGKSFLSVALALRGVAFLADDHVTVSWKAQQPIAHLATPAARLHRQSISTLWPGPGNPMVRSSPVAQYTDKRRVQAAAGGFVTAEASPLRAIVVLGNEQYHGPVNMQRMSPAQAVSALAQHTMTNYPHNQSGQTQLLDDVARMADITAVWSLDYQRNMTAVAEVDHQVRSSLRGN